MKINLLILITGLLISTGASGFNPAPLDSMPNVYTDVATLVTNTSAQLNGEVRANGQATTVTFEYGTTTAYGNVVSATPSVVTGTNFTAVIASLSGLIPLTTYHFRCVGVNSLGTTYGGDVTFYTGTPAAPTVTTTAATSIFAKAVCFNGTVNANGSSTSTSFQYGMTPSYGTTVSGVPSSVTGSTITPINKYVNNLIPSTTYHYRSRGINSIGTSYGADMTFITADTVPSVSTSNATAVGVSIAQLNGTVNANNQTAAASFEWGLTSSYGNTVSATPSTVTGYVTNAVATTLTGLTPSTTYHFRCVASNASGTSYGQDKVFTTGSGVSLPFVYTGIATSVTNSSAVLNGTVTANNGATTVSFQFGTTPAYGNTVSATPATVNGTTPTNVSAPIFGLLPQTTYHFRCVGTNSAGTIYGMDTTFTTGDTLAWVQTEDATLVTQTSAQLNGLVNPLNLTATVSFEWGLSNSYGNTIAAVPPTVTGGTGVPVMAALTGLSQNTTYHFRCVANNIAGNSYGADKTFTTGCTMPGPVAPVIGPDTVFTGMENVVFSCTAQSGVTYFWTVPAGAYIVSGSGTNCITVSFSDTAVSGLVSVYASNSCGSSPAASHNVVVMPELLAPVINQNGTILSSNYSSGNQWYLNGAIIPEAVTQQWDATLSGTGTYYDIVTIAGVQSPPSAPVYIIIQGTGNEMSSAVTVNSVGEDGLFLFRFRSAGWSVVVYNLNGQEVWRCDNQGTGTVRADLKSSPAGIYFAAISNGYTSMIKKLTVTR